MLKEGKYVKGTYGDGARGSKARGLLLTTKVALDCPLFPLRNVARLMSNDLLRALSQEFIVYSQ